MLHTAEEQTPNSAITSIKSQVAQSLRSADSEVDIRTTEYFNHTFAPDIILRWPRQKAERHVYLRTSANIDYLIEDVSLARDPNSIFMPLARVEFNDASDSLRERLETTSRSQSALVTEPESFSALGEARSNRPVVGLASRSLLQGGNGYVAPLRAARFGDTLADAFQRAQVPVMDESPDSVQQAVQDAEDLLDSAHAARLAASSTRFGLARVEMVPSFLAAKELRLLRQVRHWNFC